jgi:poly-gamma-glutamate capsule biosynthesis protein CapA/YwtB (metallophosphatase superfamily)
VCAGGDVTLGTNLDTAWAVRATRAARRRVAPLPPPARLVAPLAPLVRAADVVLLNVEGAIGDDVPVSAKCARNATACYALRQPARAAAALRAVAPRARVVGNLANNHARDAGAAGLRSTIAHLDAAGVAVTGFDTLATAVVTARGDTVAFLGFSTSAIPDARDVAAVRRHVARAAAQYARVVVTAHVGAEGVRAQRTRDATERYAGEHRGNPVAFADAAVAGGAALVVMHGPHVLRAAEWRRGRLVAYSLGNLVTYGPFAFREPITRGALLCASVDGDGAARNAAFRATRQRHPGLVSPDATGRAYVLVDSLSRLDFPRTGVRVSRTGVLLPPRGRGRATR